METKKRGSVCIHCESYNNNNNNNNNITRYIAPLITLNAAQNALKEKRIIIKLIKINKK